VQPSADALPPADGVTVIEYGKGPAASPGGEPAPLTSPVAKPDATTLAMGYAKVFVGSSIFTLKRIIGDEVQKLVALRLGKGAPADGRERLAVWYGKWVVRLAGMGVDFGLPQRLRADELFHYQWAIAATPDRLQWEMLNRLHRLLNQANKQKQ
jgi:hypothetical protein